MSWAGMDGRGIRRWVSDVEANRFGLSVERVVVGTNATDSHQLSADFAAVLGDTVADLVIARWPSHLSSLGAVAASSGRHVIPADVLMYWEIPAQRLAASAEQLPAGYVIEHPASSSTAAEDAISEVISDSFKGYGNHYTANPALDPDLALAGYLEWAVSALRESPSNVVLLRHGATPVGVATLTASDADLEVELAGMTSATQGQGLYRFLLAAVGETALARRHDRVIISTQAQNIRVQRAWARLGMRPFGAITTTHLVSRLI